MPGKKQIFQKTEVTQGQRRLQFYTLNSTHLIPKEFKHKGFDQRLYSRGVVEFSENPQYFVSI